MASNFTYGTNDPNQTYYYGNQPSNINSTSPPTYNTQPTLGSTSSSTQQTYNSPVRQGIFAAPPAAPAAPAPPNYSNLENQLNAVQRQGAIKKAMANYDALAATTKAAGFQAASNAGSVYAQRLQQQGINPVASGVVAAQAKLPVYSALEGIEQQKDQTRLTAVNQSQQLAAQIANQIAGLQLNYSGMLADYNKANTGYNLDLNKFNAGQAFNQQQYQTDTYFKQQQLAAQAASMAASGHGNQNNVGGVRPGFSPGYIPNSGPIVPSTSNGVPSYNQVSVGY